MKKEPTGHTNLITHCRVPIRYTCSSFMFPSEEMKYNYKSSICPYDEIDDTLTNIYVNVPQLTRHDKFMVWLDLRFPRLFKLYYKFFIRKNTLLTPPDFLK